MSFRYNFSRARKVLAFVAVFMSGLILGAVSLRQCSGQDKAAVAESVETRAAGYRFIKPLMECDSTGNTELKSFKAEIEAAVRQQIGAGYATRISVYFRDLNNGPWFSVNPEEDFIPSSLLKVPTMISILRVAEADPSFLRRVEVLPQGFPIDRNMEQNKREPLKPGVGYSVEELLFRMIVYSDNSAAILLNKLLPVEIEQETYRDLGVGFHEGSGRRDWLSVETYSSFFRILFNATYLNREMSEKALALLAQSDLPPGLPNLAPPGVQVAKKFGHYKLPGAGESDQLHVCGVVYHPGHPYLVCIMTRGNDVGNLSTALSEISSEIYRHVAGQRGAGD